MPFGADKWHAWLREDDSFDRYNKPGSSDWFDLSDDVSFAKPNNRHDTLKVESLLGYGGYMDLEKSGGPLGLAQHRLEEPIKEFQAKNGLTVDGLLKPGGPTITKMKELYGDVFGGTPAPTPAMVDANAEVTHAGEDGFLYDKGPRFGVRPNKRLDGKAHLMEFERWNREWARGSGNDPKSLAPEYESYIRDLDTEHGHDPGLIFARDLIQQVGKFHGQESGAELAKALVVRLSDRPDLQRELLGGEVPQSPPIGMFKPGGEQAVKAWIDQDRIANGVARKHTATIAAISQERGAAESDPGNLLEYVQHFGGPEPPPLAQNGPDSDADTSDRQLADDEDEDDKPDDPDRARECAEIREALAQTNDKIEKIKDRIADIKFEAERLTEQIQILEKAAGEPTAKPEATGPRDPRKPRNRYQEAARLILKTLAAAWRALEESEKRRKIEEGIVERKNDLSLVERALADTEAEWDALEKELFRLHGRRIELKCDDGPIEREGE